MPTANLPSQRFNPKIYGVGAWTSHLFFACDLMALVRPRVFVELGTDRGESYFAFCQSAAENKSESRCFAVDTWRGDRQSGGYDETTFEQVTAHNQADYSGFSTLLRCTFDEALDQFGSESIDLLHLDGLHSQDAAQHDVDSWLPKVRPGGLLLLHDVMVRGRGFGVWKVWEELCRHGRNFTFPDGPGLGLWQKNPVESLPEPIETLFSRTEPERSRLVEYYRERVGELGQRIAQDWRDGTVRHQPFMQQTVIQVFYSENGRHREEDSVNARIGHGEWKNVAMQLPQGARAAPLRIDFVSPLTMIEIESIRLQAESGLHFVLDRPDQFDGITVRGDAHRLAHPSQLRLEITGIDPQLYLPPIPTTGENLLLELRLRVRPNQ